MVQKILHAATRRRRKERVTLSYRTRSPISWTGSETMTLARAVQGSSASRVESRRGECFGRRARLDHPPRGRQRASFFTPKIDVYTADKDSPTRRRSVGQTRKECSWQPGSQSLSTSLAFSERPCSKQCTDRAVAFAMNRNTAFLPAICPDLILVWSLAREARGAAKQRDGEIFCALSRCQPASMTTSGASS